MHIFKDQNLLEFSDRYKSDDACKEYLANIKAESSFKYLRFNHAACQTRSDFSRQCNICRRTESATADTLFHKVKFGVRKAFFICFEVLTFTKSLSANYMGVRYGVTAKAFNTTQIESNKGLNFKALHTMMHQVKSWIRTTYSWVSDDTLNRCFNEFYFRINKFQSKETIFNYLITKMILGNKIYQTELISN